MDFDGFDQTQAIALDDYSDDTDDLGDLDNKPPVGYLKVFSQKSFLETSFPVFEGDNFIGRHESNQICIPLKALSKKHACIEIQGDSHLIYDLESRNKTRRGKLFLKPSVRYELQDPDSLLFGDIRCEYTRAEIQKKPTELAEDSDDDESDTGSESMLLDSQNAKDKAQPVKGPDLGSSSSYDILQPTQAHQDRESRHTIILETPQREGATLVFAESSDDNAPAEAVKAVADSSISPGSIAETPATKPSAAGRSKLSELDVSALAMAPTQPYGGMDELETQAYPANTDSDDDEIRQSLFDAPTQAFAVPESEDEMESHKGTRKKNKRTSVEPTMILNLSTDDETSPVKRPARPKPYPQQEAAGAPEKHPQGYTDEDGETSTLAYTDLATQAYCADTDDQSDDDADKSSKERPQARDTSENDDEPTLAFPDLATQAFCTETDEQSDEDDEFGIRSKRRAVQTLDPTVKYDMQEESPDAGPDQGETDSDADVQKRRVVEPTLKYDMDVEDDDKRSKVKVDIGLEPTIAYTTEEDDEEDMDVSALAIAEAQAYTTTDSDLDEEQPKPNTGRRRQQTAREQATVFSDAPTLAYDDIKEDLASGQPKAGLGDEGSSDAGYGPCDEATLAYNDDDEDDATDTGMPLDEGEERMMGYAEMETQPAGKESDIAGQPDVPTLQYNTTEDEDDTTAATQAYGVDKDEDETPDIHSHPDAPTLQYNTTEDEDDTTAATQAYGTDDTDDDTLDIITNPSTSLGHVTQPANQNGGQKETSAGPSIAGTKPGGNRGDGLEETQVPDSQDGAVDEMQPLVGMSRISSMLRKVPVRSAMASPEKKHPQRTRRVAFKEQTPPEEAASEEVNPPSRKSARGRKAPARFREETPTSSVTETDAKPTRRKSKEFRSAPGEEEASDVAKPKKAAKGKQKGSKDVLEGSKDVLATQGKLADGDSEEDTLELQEGSDMVWTSVGGFQLIEANNNETEPKGKAPARRTSRRQASYKKAVEGHDSDDTESMSSTSSLQVEVGDLSGSAVQVQVTVCDGKQSEDASKPRRGRRSNTGKAAGTSSGRAEKLAKEVDEPSPESSRQPATTSGRRQSRRSAVIKSDVAETLPKPITKVGRGQHNQQSTDVPKQDQKSKEDIANLTQPSRDHKNVTGSETKEITAPARRGRKPKSAATPQTKGPKQSSITDFTVAVAEDKVGSRSHPEESSSISENKTDSLESNDSPSLLPSNLKPAKTSAPSSHKKQTTPQTKSKSPDTASQKQDAFVAPEPVKRGGRPRKGAKQDEGQRSTESPPVTSQPQTATSDKAETATQGRSKKKGRNSGTMETPQKEEQPAATPTSNRRGKRAGPAQTTPSPTPTKKRKDPETPESEVSSPSLRKRPSETKPKVMFTGVVNKTWEKIVTSLGGELVESVFDCTHLVTDKVRRTVKFLCCLSRGALIIAPKWLDQCQLHKTFVDPSPYLLQDKAAEKQYSFSHVTSHQRALQGGALGALSVFVTANVKPEPAQMKEIIQSAGGKCLSIMPKKPDPSTIIVSCDADEARCQPAIKAGLQVVSAEFILTGMLRQETRPELYQLFTPSSTSSEPSSKRKVGDTPSSSKRRR
ncbi:mediator of DNA damage checkpoint protein 1-like isoform X2 [Patiria miniata]|uniref:Mediator of DNA damage checkpoint protein 1 n=1 Tax=Patiria miniata TaxID=46514 RepID=A0A914A0W4_PATMI|nr:mediator of DNA damage checkpoint protein 1-like isoform X2 [Patiria miniata]